MHENKKSNFMIHQVYNIIENFWNLSNKHCLVYSFLICWFMSISLWDSARDAENCMSNDYNWTWTSEKSCWTREQFVTDAEWCLLCTVAETNTCRGKSFTIWSVYIVWLAVLALCDCYQVNSFSMRPSSVLRYVLANIVIIWMICSMQFKYLRTAVEVCTMLS